MRNFPTNPMRQHTAFITALCRDWREAGTVTRVTPHAERVVEISKQLNRESGCANNAPDTNQ